MSRRLVLAVGLVTAILATVWSSSAGAGAAGKKVTVVPVPNRFTTVPFASSSRLGGGTPAAPNAVKPDHAVINKAGAQSETTIAIDPTNPRHLLATSNDLANFSSFHNVYESFDLGTTWVDAGVNIATFCYDPWLAFNNAGDAFFSYECSDERIAYRNHGSSTWVYTTLQDSSLFPDRDAVVADRNTASPFVNSVYVGYDEANSNNAAHVWYSRDGKTGWVKSPKINDTSSTIGVNPATGPDGTVYATWEDFNGKKIWVDKSTNGGVSWGTDHVVTNYRLGTQAFFICIPPQPDRCVVPMPFTAVDNTGGVHNGRLYVAYPDKDPVTTDWNIYVRYSDDGGTTWSAETMVNDDTVHGYQFFPAIAVSANGTVGVSFYDTRDDQPLNHKTNRYWTFSTDGGVTWAANQKLSTAQSDESGVGDANDYGDYEGGAAGVTPRGVNFFAWVWTDSRVGSMAEDVWNTVSKA